MMKLRPDWWRKTLAGAVLGWPLALALTGLLAWYGPGGLQAPNKVQFLMWMIAPIWMLVFSLVYLIPTGTRALLGLFGANVVAYGLLFWARSAVPA